MFEIERHAIPALIGLGLTVALCGRAMATGEIAYIAYSDPFWQVWVMNEDGTDRREISKSPYDKGRISWYPDGSHLLVNGTQGQIARLDTGSGEEVSIPLPIDGVADAVIGPNGKTIAFSASAAGAADRNDLWLVGVDGEGLRKLTRMRGLQHEPTWAPSGDALYFLSGITGPTKRDHDVWRLEIESGSVQQLTHNALYHFDVAVSADGSIAYSSNRTGDYEIWIRSPEGMERQWTSSPGLDSNPAFSPDGREIVFQSRRGGELELWKARTGDSADPAIPLTNDGPEARNPTWFGGR